MTSQSMRTWCELFFPISTTAPSREGVQSLCCGHLWLQCVVLVCCRWPQRGLHGANAERQWLQWKVAGCRGAPDSVGRRLSGLRKSSSWADMRLPLKAGLLEYFLCRVVSNCSLGCMWHCFRWVLRLLCVTVHEHALMLFRSKGCGSDRTTWKI